MKKKLLLLLMLVFLVVATAGVVTVYALSTETFTLDGTIKASYELGKKAVIPEATFTVEGKKYNANHAVYFPDGVVSSDSEVTLSVRGNYTLVYSVNVGGTIYTKEYTFYTDVPFGSFNTSKSSYNYWLNPDWDTLDGTGEYSSVNEKQLGLTVSIAKNDVFTVNEILNLRNAEKNSPFIKFYLMPKDFGELDASKFYIKMTDAFDPDNSITVEYRLGLGQYAYDVAKATGQVWIGLEPRYNGGKFTGYSIHINNSYGSSIENNGGGLKSNNCVGVQPLSLWYISEENALYNGGYAYNSLLVDFDDEEYQLVPWKGFSSDYVYVSMWADGYNKDTCRVFITDLCGAHLSTEYVIDNGEPEITVNCKDVDIMNMPEGGVGLKYKVFSATANDLYAVKPLKVGTKVLLGYNRVSGVYHTADVDYTGELDCSNGYFTPKRAGNYSIIYYATDYSGNYTEVVSNVEIKDAFDDTTYIEIADAITETQVGNRISLAQVATFGGYRGSYTISYSVKKGDENIALCGNAVTGFNFVPKTAGEYNVEIALSDLVGGGAAQCYTVTVTNATMPSISDDVELPAYFISEYTYKLPTLYAYNYNDGMKKVKTNVRVKDGAGVWTYYGGEVSFSADENGLAEITYYLLTNERTYKVPVVSIYENSDIIIGKMFALSEGAVDISAVEKGVSVSSRNTNGTVEFVKKILAETFATELSIENEKNDFSQLEVILSDSVERTNRIIVSLKKENDSASVFVNGIDTGKDIENVFSSGNKIIVSYSDKDNSIKVGGIKIYLVENELGEEFDGFTSGYVYVSYGMKNVSSRSTFYVQKINNQTLNSGLVEDKVKPEFALKGSYSNLVVEKGSVVTVWSAVFGDVLSNIASETVSISFNGNYITDLSGRVMKNATCTEEYSFIANEYGTYIITYLVKDTANRKQGGTYTVHVVDMTAPVISTEMKNGKATLGDKINFAKATATDNLDGEVQVYVYVICPNYQALDLNDNDCFYAREKGAYIVRYMAFDSEGNTTYKDYEIVVE